MSFMIGKSVYENKGGRSKFFYLSPGTNVYRILPPMFSLAPKGLWYKYWGVHKGFVNSAGKYRPLASIEEFDIKTKTVRVHDPISEKYRENLAKAKAARDKGMPEEKVREFSEVYVKPYDTDKKYYVNAVNQANEIGQLVIPTKLFQQLKALCKEYEAKNIDLTGMKGVFLNFKKIQAYKGDPQTSYSCEIYREEMPDSQGGLTSRPKVHDITEDFIVRLQNEAKDLATLFKIPTASDLALLAEAAPNERAAVIDRIFGKADVESDEEGGQDEEGDGVLGVTIPNTGGAKAVGVMDLASGNLGVSLPQMPTAAPTTPTVSQQQKDFFNTATKPAAQPTAQASGETQDFDAMFTQMFGK